MLCLAILPIFLALSCLGSANPLGVRINLGRDEISEGPGIDGSPLLVDTSGGYQETPTVILRQNKPQRSVYSNHERTPVWNYLGSFFNPHSSNAFKELETYYEDRPKSVIKITQAPVLSHHEYPDYENPFAESGYRSVVKSVPSFKEDQQRGVLKIYNEAPIIRPATNIDSFHSTRHRNGVKIIQDDYDSVPIIRPATNTDSFDSNRQRSGLKIYQDEFETIPIIRPATNIGNR